LHREQADASGGGMDEHRVTGTDTQVTQRGMRGLAGGGDNTGLWSGHGEWLDHDLVRAEDYLFASHANRAHLTTSSPTENPPTWLRWDDFDAKAATLSINRGLAAVDYELHKTRGKTASRDFAARSCLRIAGSRSPLRTTTATSSVSSTMILSGVSTRYRRPVSPLSTGSAALQPRPSCRRSMGTGGGGVDPGSARGS